VEHQMMDLMYDIPSRDDVESVAITPGVIESGDSPVLSFKKEGAKEKEKASSSKKQEKLA
ncbi:MAG TPA: ATP-dependent Clp protease ATP-binding subunit ClpX, partial [Leptospiraceae bacterium]|nr:ATP-dependent Clp protease ATP-binding subunit ClpX [Leptospiraceae bacterium]